VVFCFLFFVSSFLAKIFTGKRLGAHTQIVEATFASEPQLRKATRAVFCLGSPKRVQHWLSQFVVPGKDQHSVSLRLGVGRYKLQAPGVRRPLFIDVEEEAQQTTVNAQLVRKGDSLEISAEHEESIYDNLEGAAAGGSSSNRVALAPGSVTIHVENNEPGEHRVQLAWRSLAHLVCICVCVCVCVTVCVCV
jgi:hypothetical protein